MWQLEQILGGRTIFSLIVVAVVAILACLGVGILTLNNGDETPEVATSSAPPTVIQTPENAPNAPAPAPEAEPVPEEIVGSEGVFAALQAGVNEADSRGGRSGAAVLVEGWSEPVVAGYDGSYRMWSTSKPLTAIGVLDRQTAPDPNVDEAMHDALVKSSNCGQRRMVLELQKQTGGIPQADNAFASVAGQSGIASLTRAQKGPPSDPTCDTYLLEHGVTDTQAETALFGTVEWTASDAASFGLNLGSGTYGPSGERVLGLLREPKEVSDDPGGEDSVRTDLNWGAGNAFPAAWRPGYKSGWGGSVNKAYMAGQVVSLIIDGTPVGIAAVFMPDVQPADDAIGEGQEDEALEDIFGEVRTVLNNQLNGGGQ